MKLDGLTQQNVAELREIIHFLPRGVSIHRHEQEEMVPFSPYHLAVDKTMIAGRLVCSILLSDVAARNTSKHVILFV